MPNWVTNNVYVIDEEGSRMFCNQIVDAMSWKDGDKVSLKQAEETITFHKVVPMPEELKGTVSPSNLPEEESKKLIDKYGSDNWYDWSWDNWGTKWDLTNCHIFKDDDGSIYSIRFDTAWNTPINFIQKLSMKFKNINIIVEYADEDIGSNYGWYEYKDGSLLNDFQFERNDYYSNLTARNILKSLQGELEEYDGTADISNNDG